MKVLHEIDENKDLALALGYFDGMHSGHKKIITTLVQYARQSGLKSAVVTFSENPSNYFSNDKTLNIQSFKDRQIMLNSLGVDYLYELDFELYKNLDAIDYLKDILVKNFSPKVIVVGYNHTFGKNRNGTADVLRDYASKLGFECVVIPEQKCANEKVSSTIIRKEIETGNLDKVRQLLGRSFAIRNSVIKGAKKATELGYPTANLVWPDSIIKLPYGVYFGWAQIDLKMHPALISWGNKPTLTNGKFEFLEAHIYNFHENLYGKIIKIIFEKNHRVQEDFKNILVLKTQIQKDYSAFSKWARLMS